MRTNVKEKRLLAILIITATFVLTASLQQGFAGLRSGQENNLGKGRTPIDELPLAVFSASAPSPGDHTPRSVRSRLFDGRFPKALDEMPGTGVIKTTHWWINLPGLPTAQSDAVVLGKTVSANAYLSSDKSNVYSEFLIRVEEVFRKDESGDSLVSGGTVTALREGGRVQVPDGRVLYLMSSDQGMPRVGQRYVFFLKYNKGVAYRIITGYKIRRGRVSLLDEVDLDRFTTYRNMDERAFLTAVREAIVNPPQVPRDRE